RVRQMPGVVSATPLIEGQVMATGENGAASGALVRGIRPDDIRSRGLIAEHIVAGSLADFGDDGIVLGERLARRLGLAGGGRDIAILRTMGASRGMVLRIFMLSGASIGVVGTLAGFALGVVFTENIEPIRQFIQGVLGVNLFSAEIYFFTRIPAHIQAEDVATVVLMALALSFLATLYPSWRAARLDPVEGLRSE